MTQAKDTRLSLISADHALGAFGCSLAVAAASFGFYMTLHGPSPSTGPSRDFTIFAQLAPRPTTTHTHGPSTTAQDLDTSPTASIRNGATEAPPPAELADAQPAKYPDGLEPSTETGPVLRGIVLTAVAQDDADVVINGRTERVRVGDLIPGAGEVLAILPGRRPMLKTSLGLIVSAR